MANPNCTCVVLIEDDNAIRESIEFLLEGEGYHVVSFANGSEALSGLKNVQAPCLILLDWMMPIMSGGDFLKAWLQARHSITVIPIVVVSAIADQLSQEKGVSGFIKKPLDVDVLMKIVERYCGTAKAA